MADWQAGRVRVVRGGKRLLGTRHHLAEAGLSREQWRARWEAARWFLAVKLPAPLAHHANAPHGRYILAARVSFAHRGAEWADRIEANRAVAYCIHHDAERGRWYITASWQRPAVTAIPLQAARAKPGWCRWPPSTAWRLWP